MPFVFFLSLVQINTDLILEANNSLGMQVTLVFISKINIKCYLRLFIAAIKCEAYILVLPRAMLTKRIPVTQCANVYRVEPVTGTVYSEGKSKEAVFSISGLSFPVSRLTAFMHTIKQINDGS